MFCRYGLVLLYKMQRNSVLGIFLERDIVWKARLFVVAYNLCGKLVHHYFQMTLEKRNSIVTPFHINGSSFKCAQGKCTENSCESQEEFGVR